MINRFQGEYFFLSNFYPASVWYDGHLYPTVEHAYQAAKTLLWHQRRQIQLLDAEQANIAKRLGKTVKLRPEWNEGLRDYVMLDLVRQKFAEVSKQELLRLTRTEELVEGNNWHDLYWGKCTCRTRGHNNEGENHHEHEEVAKSPYL